jgi:hypothetical protein
MSTAIAQSDYDDFSRTLTITFTDGTVYEYYGVPPAVFQAVSSDTTSKGTYFNRDVRRAYSYSRIG